MKKLSAFMLAIAMVMATAVPAFAAEKMDSEQKAADFVKRFKAVVKLDSAMYNVHYTKQSGEVKIHVKNEKGHEKWTVTREQAVERVKTFVEGLQLKPTLSKQEIVDRLSEALGVEPTDVEGVQANIAFTNGSTIAVNYHKGNKKSEQPWGLERLQLTIVGEDGFAYQAKFFNKAHKMMAQVKKTTEEGTETYRGIQAMEQLMQLKAALTNVEGVTLEEYKEQLSEVLGVELDDIENLHFKVSSNNHSKFHVAFNK